MQMVEQDNKGEWRPSMDESVQELLQNWSAIGKWFLNKVLQEW